MEGRGGVDEDETTILGRGDDGGVGSGEMALERGKSASFVSMGWSGARLGRSIRYSGGLVLPVEPNELSVRSNGGATSSRLLWERCEAAAVDARAYELLADEAQNEWARLGAPGRLG